MQGKQSAVGRTNRRSWGAERLRAISPPLMLQEHHGLLVVFQSKQQKSCSHLWLWGCNTFPGYGNF